MTNKTGGARVNYLGLFFGPVLVVRPKRAPSKGAGQRLYRGARPDRAPTIGQARPNLRPPLGGRRGAAPAPEAR